MTTSPNDPVFPEQWLDQRFSDVIPTLCSKGGLTKRELFAALAMQAIIAGTLAFDAETDCNSIDTAYEAVSYADALIEALNEEGE